MTANSSLDPWSDAAITETLRDHYGVGTDTDLPDDIRFVGSVAKLIRKRIKLGENSREALHPAVFFLHPNTPQYSGTRRSRPVRMLDTGRHRVLGCLWFVNKLASNATAIELAPSDDDNELFDLAIDELGVGAVPAIVFETRADEPQLRYYPNGLMDSDAVQVISIAGQSITINEIFNAIDRIHEQQLCTPTVQQNAIKLWRDSHKYHVETHAEEIIQGLIRAGLTALFASCTVRAEQSQATGRLDIEIEEHLPEDRSKVIRHAVLELKVLRAFGSTGLKISDKETEEWTRSGVKQAATYRDEKGCRLAALCCFDMRKENIGDKCFDHVRDLAERLSVEMRSWHIFASSAALRADKVG